jgi:hypothetical protein
MLHLLVDTSTWLDLAKQRDGQKWIVAIRLNIQWGNLRLLVPSLVIDEFVRNRDRIKTLMTTSVTDRFRQMRRDFNDYGGESNQEAFEMIDTLAYQVPLIGAMTTRNFDDILELLRAGEVMEPTEEQCRRVVQRGLDKRAPFHRSRNSVADALLIELYGSAITAANLDSDPHGFVTSNSDDFSLAIGDRRLPHEDLADHFAVDGSSYWFGVEGLTRQCSMLLATITRSYSMSPTSERIPGGSMRSSRLSPNCSIASGITDRSRMTTSLERPATRSSANGTPTLQAPVGAG